MELLHTYFWAIVLLAILLVTLVIVMTFIIIIVCLSKRAAQYHTQTKPNYSDSKLKMQDNPVFHKNIEIEKPPLPPRDQFQSMDSVEEGYEHVEPLPDYVEVEEQSPDEHQQPFTPHAMLENKSQDTVSVSEDYDDVEMPADCDSEDYDDIA